MPKFMWGSLLLCSIIVATAANAWTTPSDFSGPFQISDNGGVTTFLTSANNNYQEVVINDGDGKKIWSFTMEKNKTLSRIALSGDGNYVATVGNGVRLLSVTDKKKLWEWTKDGRWAVSISKDGTWINAGGYTGKAYLFKKNSSTPVKTWDLGAKEDSPLSSAISDDGKISAVATNQTVFLFKDTSNSPQWSAKSDDRVQEVKLSTDGQYLLGVAANSVYVWDTKSNKPIWSKKWKGSLVGAAISSTGNKVVVSHGKGISVFDNAGNELRHFDNSFGNSDLAMSANGRYFYVNDGGGRLYAFDDSYATGELRPFRIVRGTMAGGYRRGIVTSGAGNIFTYKIKDSINIEKSMPAVLAISPGIPVLIKDTTFDMGTFVTNPSVTSQPMSVSITLGTAANEWWSKVTSKISDREPASIKSKLLSYAASELTNVSSVHTENMTLAAGTSKESHFSVDVPDLENGTSFSDSLASGMSNLSPMALVSKLLDKIKGPLSKLVGKDAANLAIGVTNRTISAETGKMVMPMLGMGTVTLYGPQGETYDQDSFYFMYIN